MRTGNYKESVGQIIALSDSKAAWAWTAALIAALIVAPYLVGAYALTLMVSALIAVIGAVGLNLLTGTTGLISLGQAGFLAVGAYTNAILLTDYHLPVWVSLPAAGVAGALVSIVVGIPSLRLKGLYLAITTLAFACIINHIILYAERLTHGPNGVFVTGAKLFGFGLQRGPALYYLTLALAVAAIFAALNLLRTASAAPGSRSAITTSPRASWASIWCAISFWRSSSVPLSSPSPARSSRCRSASSISTCSR